MASAAAAVTRRGAVVVTRRLPPAVLAAFAAAPATRGLPVHVWDSDEPMPRAELLEYVSRDGGASALVVMLSDAVDAALLAAAGPNLAVVSTMSVGVSHIDVAACRAGGVRIGYTPGVLTEATADLVLALTLATARRLPEAAAAVTGGTWKAWSPFWLTGKDLFGATVGIVGAGRIGAAVARRLKGFGCTLTYTGRSGPKPELDAELGATWRPMDALLAASDFVIVVCALTPETRGLLGAGALRSMKPDAVLINASRGEVVDQAALVAVLRERPGMRAGLDVCTPEPLPTDDPLLSLPNCLVLPHIGSASTQTRLAMARLAVDNAVAGVAGAPMPAQFE